MPDASPAPDAATNTAPPARSGMLGRLAVVGFVLTVVAVECVLAYMFLPGQSQTQALAQSVLEEVAARKKEEERKAEEETETDQFKEVELGEFRVTSYRAESSSTWYIEFKLFGTINASEEGEFDELRKQVEHRFRDQIIVIIRSMNRNDFADAGLGLIKRQILERTNKTLGKPMLKSVFFSDFSFQEQ